MNLYDEMNANRRMTALFICLFTAFFLLVGLGLDRYFGAGYRMPFFTVLALVFAAFSALGAYRYGDRMILAATSARRPRPDDLKERQWKDVAEEMAVAAGLPVPAVYVIDDPGPNAFATGRGPDSASLAATTGLLRRLDREELEGVAGHEMSHVRNYDVRLMLVVTVLAGSVILLADWAARSFIWTRGRRTRNEGLGAFALVVWLAAVVLAPFLAEVMSLFVSRKREYLADAAGAELTRDPLALAGALEKISAYEGRWRDYNRGTQALWIEEPRQRRRGLWQRLFSTHPPVEDRIRRLRSMAYAAAAKSL